MLSIYDVISLCSSGNKDEVKRLIATKEYDVNEKDDDGNDLLHFFAIVGDQEMIRFLVENGANLDAIQGNGKTTLTTVVARNEGLAKFLIDLGAKVDARNKDGTTAFQRMVLDQESKRADFLLKNGADINLALLGYENNLLIFLLVNESFEMAEFLIKRGVDLTRNNENGENALDFIIASYFSRDDDEDLEELDDIVYLVMEILQKDNPVFDEDYVNRLRTLTFAKVVSRGLFSSKENAAGLQVIFNLASIIKELSTIQGFEFAESYGEYIDAVIDDILEEKFKSKDSADDREFRIVKSALIGHASYFVVECNGEGKPLLLHYVDGNNQSNFGLVESYGDVVFALNSDLSFDEVCAVLKEVTSTTDFNSEFATALDKLGVVKEDGKHAQHALYVPAKAQEHDNCGYKSLDLLMRLMLHLQYGLDVSKDGEGWKIYKDYRNDLKEHCVDYFLSLANDEDSLICSQALVRLAEIRSKLESKEDPFAKRLLEKLSPVLGTESSLQNPKGENLANNGERVVGV